MPQRPRRVGCERIPDINVVVIRPWGVFSTIDGEDLPFSSVLDVICEQVRAFPLAGNDILQLPVLVCVGRDAEADIVGSVVVIFKHIGITPTSDL